MHESSLDDGDGAEGEDKDLPTPDADEREDSIDEEFDAPAESGDDEEDFESTRQLCPDESCIGVIGTEGRCAECGTMASDSADGADTANKPASANAKAAEGVDLIHRNLCPDGGCIGVLGPDGRCKDCGLVGENVLTDPRLRGLKTPPIGDSDDEDEQEEEEDDEEEATSDADADADAEPSPIAAKAKSDVDDDKASPFSNRHLCPDGNCIGIIGPDGACKECGTVL